MIWSRWFLLLPLSTNTQMPLSSHVTTTLVINTVKVIIHHPLFPFKQFTIWNTVVRKKKRSKSAKYAQKICPRHNHIVHNRCTSMIWWQKTKLSVTIYFCMKVQKLLYRKYILCWINYEYVGLCETKDIKTDDHFVIFHLKETINSILYWNNLL